MKSQNNEKNMKKNCKKIARLYKSLTSKSGSYKKNFFDKTKRKTALELKEKISRILFDFEVFFESKSGMKIRLDNGWIRVKQRNYFWPGWGISSAIN